MTGTYKEFYKFIESLNSNYCRIWEEYNNRPDPQVGDEYYYYNPCPTHQEDQTFIIVFDKILYDPKFTNGIAFYYIFHRKDNGKEFKLHCINDVIDPSKLSILDGVDLYSFWNFCEPVK